MNPDASTAPPPGVSPEIRSTRLMGRLRDGRLSDMKQYAPEEQREGGSDLVPLLELPGGLGPYAYDPIQRVAAPAPLSERERFARALLPSHTLGALVALLAPSATDEERACASKALDEALVALRHPAA